MREEIKVSAIAGIVYTIVMGLVLFYLILPYLAPWLTYEGIAYIIGEIWQYWLLLILANGILFPVFYLIAERVGKGI